VAEERVTRRGLVACGTLELIALAVWIGGLIVIIGAVIPAVFNAVGMEPGGRLLTRIFDGYNRLTAVAIVILMAAGVWRIRLGLRDPEAGLRRFEVGLLTLMIVIAALIALWLGPASVTLQEQAFTAQDEAAKKAAYDSFFRTHTLVRRLYLLNLALGCVLLTVKVNGWVGSSKTRA
jgi:uncharacterized membrane protein